MTDGTPGGPAEENSGPFDLELPPRPYPGLRAFEKSEWPIFFGRELITNDIIERLADNQFIALHGDSGCGKSSLIRAGVLPRLETDYARAGVTWRTTDMLPRNAPLRHLAAALARLEQDPPDPDRVIQFRRLLNLGRKAATAVARELRISSKDYVCILIDQFEEVFQLAYRGRLSEAQQFVEVLIGFQQAPPPGGHVVLTMRSEFLGACARFDDLARAINDTQFLLPNMTSESLLRAIREPARLYGGHVERRLAERIVDDAGGGQDQLPLIQHAMLLLQTRHAPGAASPDAPGDWTLREEHYSATGGLGQLLSDHAEEVLQSVQDRAGEAGLSPDHALAVLERLFRGLTGIDPDGRAVRRPQTLAELVELTETPRQTLLALIAPLMADGVSFLRIYGQHPYPDDALVDISHEALIRNWRRLQDWCEHEAQDGAIYQRLQALAADRRREPDLLLGVREARDRDVWWHRVRVTQAWAARHGTRLPDVGPDEVRDLLDQSQDSEAQEFQFWCEQTEYARTLWEKSERDDSALLVGLVLVQAEDWLKRRGEAVDAELLGFIECSRERRDALQRAHDVQERRRRLTRYAVSVIGFFLALVASWGWFEAEKTREEAITQKELADEQKELADKAREEAVEQERYARIALEFSRTRYEAADDALRQAIIPQARRLTDIARHRLRIGDPTGAVLLYLSAFSVLPENPLAWPGDSRLYSGEIERYLYAATGVLRHPITVTAHEGAINRIVYAPDGSMFATAGDDRSVRLGDAETGETTAVLTGHEGAVLDVAFSPDSALIATASADGTVRLWKRATGAEIAVLRGHADRVVEVAFAPDGSRVASGAANGSVRIWNPATGREIAAVSDPAGAIRGVAFSPDGLILVTAAGDATVRLRDPSTGVAEKTIEFPGGEVLSVDGLSEGVRVTTVSSEGRLTVWNEEAGSKFAVLAGDRAQARAIAFSADGAMIATAGADGTVRLWRPGTRQLITVLRRHRTTVRGAAFSVLGDRVATASADGVVRLWTVYSDANDLIRRAQRLVPRCLTLSERAAAYLPLEPPRWCIEGPEEEWDPALRVAGRAEAKPPYDTPEWRAWLDAIDSGEDPPMPGSPDNP